MQLACQATAIDRQRFGIVAFPRVARFKSLDSSATQFLACRCCALPRATNGRERGGKERRPLGSDSFLRALESLLARPLLRQKPGRKPKNRAVWCP
jgi:hypothetical protein